MAHTKQKPAPLAWEALRKRPGDLETICRAISPVTQNRACADALKWLLRVWNTRTPRLDGHMAGEWKFASHDQLVQWGAATSVRSAERTLRLLGDWQETRENAGLIEKRKAHLGDARNVLHLRPTSHLLAIMDAVATCHSKLPDKKVWAEFLAHICRPIEDATPEQDATMATTELRRVARQIRRDRTYGKSALAEDLRNIVWLADLWAKDKSTAKMAVHNGGSTAKVAVHMGELTAKMAVTDLVTGELLVTGASVTGKLADGSQEDFQGDKAPSGDSLSYPPPAPQKPPPEDPDDKPMTKEEFESALSDWYQKGE